MKITKKSITLLLAGLLCASNSFSQTYPKQDGVIRLLTYNLSLIHISEPTRPY